MPPSSQVSSRLARNSFYNFLAYVWPMLFSFIVTPLVVHKLGATSYGVYALIQAIIGFLGLMDLGLNTALIKYIAAYESEGKWGNLQKLINSAFVLYIIIALCGFLTFFVLGFFFAHVFNITQFDRDYVFTICMLAGCAFVVSTLAQIYAVVPIALQRYGIATKISTANVVLFNAGLLSVVILYPDLRMVLLWYIVSVCFLLIIYRYYFRILLPNMFLQVRWDAVEIRKAYKFGLYSAVTNIATNALFQLDRFLIPIFVGPAPLTYYTLPGNIAQKISGIGSSLTHVLFPAVSSLVGRGEYVMIGHLYRRAIRNVAVLAAAGASACAFLAYPLLRYWIDANVAGHGSVILALLAVTHYLLALYIPLQFCLLGIGKSKFLMVLSLTLACANVILLVILVPRFGIAGAAWAYLLSIIPMPFVSVWVEKSILRLNGVVYFYVRLYAKLAVVTTLIYIISKLLYPYITSLPTVLFSGLVLVGAFLVLYWLFGFMDPEDISFIKARLPKRIARML